MRLCSPELPLQQRVQRRLLLRCCRAGSRHGDPRGSPLPRTHVPLVILPPSLLHRIVPLIHTLPGLRNIKRLSYHMSESVPRTPFFELGCIKGGVVLHPGAQTSARAPCCALADLKGLVRNDRSRKHFFFFTKEMQQKTFARCPS